jgi:hypothetical protein
MEEPFSTDAEGALDTLDLLGATARHEFALPMNVRPGESQPDR